MNIFAEPAEAVERLKELISFARRNDEAIVGRKTTYRGADGRAGKFLSKPPPLGPDG
ncbi:hypothetical protein P6U16_25220 (plasmid) [Rhizobium sp. 32-5/1]|uniref:hypothetical protein n=1 Tax=Rhizobium sp. 32-5/1 TaxID=3019602 RepID=UPI00240DB9B5|nr:hypothetical protein [Rhizobium sp. 32-5/1]WEZ85405.1 hypothetical protein P6U16_25220 [Rhizobium sp. 32-5/1]